MLFINSLVWQIANINPFFVYIHRFFFDFSNNQGTFWTPGDDDDYLIFQINNK